MWESKIFCSVIVFTIGIYTILVLQFEIFTDNPSSSYECSNATKKYEFSLRTLNCETGSASELLTLRIQNCTDLPCDIISDVNYAVELNLLPSRNISMIEIETYVRERSNYRYRHKQIIHTQAIENVNTTIKFSFMFPPRQALKLRKTFRRCPILHRGYLLGVQIWDVPTGIEEVCFVVPLNVWTASKGKQPSPT